MTIVHLGMVGLEEQLGLLAEEKQRPGNVKSALWLSHDVRSTGGLVVLSSSSNDLLGLPNDLLWAVMGLELLFFLHNHDQSQESLLCTGSRDVMRSFIAYLGTKYYFNKQLARKLLSGVTTTMVPASIPTTQVQAHVILQGMLAYQQGDITGYNGLLASVTIGLVMNPPGVLSSSSLAANVQGYRAPRILALGHGLRSARPGLWGLRRWNAPWRVAHPDPSSPWAHPRRAWLRLWNAPTLSRSA